MITRVLLPLDSLGEPTAGLEAATVLQTHQRTEVAASFRQKLAKPGPLEPNQVARLSQKVEGDGLLPWSLPVLSRRPRVCLA